MTTAALSATLDVLADPAIVECVARALNAQRREDDALAMRDPMVRNDGVTHDIYTAGRDRDNAIERLEMLLRRRIRHTVRAERASS